MHGIEATKKTLGAIIIAFGAIGTAVAFYNGPFSPASTVQSRQETISEDTAEPTPPPDAVPYESVTAPIKPYNEEANAALSELSQSTDSAYDQIIESYLGAIDPSTGEISQKALSQQDALIKAQMQRVEKEVEARFSAPPPSYSFTILSHATKEERASYLEHIGTINPMSRDDLAFFTESKDADVPEFKSRLQSVIAGYENAEQQILSLPVPAEWESYMRRGLVQMRRQKEALILLAETDTNPFFLNPALQKLEEATQKYSVVANEFITQLKKEHLL